jgi:hypothetical protein
MRKLKQAEEQFHNAAKNGAKIDACLIAKIGLMLFISVITATYYFVREKVTRKIRQ